MDIIKIVDNDKTKYMDLLLIADEQIDMIEKYLYRGEMFALYDNELKSICVVTQEEPGLYEIKNIVTVPEHQKKGYGERLISFVTNHYKDFGKELYLGTGDCTKTNYEFISSHIFHHANIICMEKKLEMAIRSYSRSSCS